MAMMQAPPGLQRGRFVLVVQFGCGFSLLFQRLASNGGGNESIVLPVLVEEEEGGGAASMKVCEVIIINYLFRDHPELNSSTF